MKMTNVKELETSKNAKFFNCGSKRLSHNIQTKLNMIPVDVYTHRKTGKTISVFVMTKELSEFLVEWAKNNPRKAKGVVV